jgi:hypothetical protein
VGGGGSKTPGALRWGSGRRRQYDRKSDREPPRSASERGKLESHLDGDVEEALLALKESGPGGLDAPALHLQLADGELCYGSRVFRGVC